ncbi:hypothetical protein NQ317_019234 [Molorchus minor]|uniref:Uncharacterized protein n=1 Tax=Molorchus minor TaxID=1323400 RepID=A0ABQ9JSJ7_9CUCU|nr:hypothetical protein NQ317_019234 [Molorchus minor]
MVEPNIAGVLDATATGAAYQAGQAGYAVATPATAAAAATYGTQRAAGYDTAYQAAAASQGTYAAVGTGATPAYEYGYGQTAAAGYTGGYDQAAAAAKPATYATTYTQRPGQQTQAASKISLTVQVLMLCNDNLPFKAIVSNLRITIIRIKLNLHILVEPLDVLFSNKKFNGEFKVLSNNFEVGYLLILLGICIQSALPKLMDKLITTELTWSCKNIIIPQQHVRSSLDYASAVWSPYYNYCDISLIEEVQTATAKPAQYTTTYQANPTGYQATYAQPAAQTTIAAQPTTQAKQANSTTTYSGYDAALYSAATMYVAQQSGGAAQQKTGGWQGYKKGGLGAKNMRAKAPPKPQQLHYCDVCKIRMSFGIHPSCFHYSKNTIDFVVLGHKHIVNIWKDKNIKREAATKMAASVAVTNQNRAGNSLRCQLCDVTCTALNDKCSKINAQLKLYKGSYFNLTFNDLTDLKTPLPTCRDYHFKFFLTYGHHNTIGNRIKTKQHRECTILTCIIRMASKN